MAAAGRVRRSAWRPTASRKPVHQQDPILVVEPDALIRKLLETWLGEAGYRIVLGTSEQPVGDCAFRLVIADVTHPGGAGSAIASLQAAYPAPILALSARFRRGLGGSTEAARRLGVRNVLPKPFTREELLAAVSEAIEGS
jgi:DNA-binding response OmpR family regulator